MLQRTGNWWEMTMILIPSCYIISFFVQSPFKALNMVPLWSKNPRSKPSSVATQKEEERLGVIPVKKESETALTHVRVVPLGPTWREKMSLPCLCIPHHWLGKAQSVAIAEWLGRKNRKCSVSGWGWSFLLSSSKAAISSEMETRCQSTPEHIHIFNT